MNDTEKEIRELEDLIRHHQFLYYVKNTPEISDYDFDMLFKKLQSLEEKYPNLASPNSPTLVVGSDLDNEFEKSIHKIPVLSLENTYSSNELIEWVNKTDPSAEYSVEWKIDGASIVLYYENGLLDKAVTRGSGGIGDNVTENIRTIKNIPMKLKKSVSIWVRGEVYMTFKDFEEFNEENDGRFANPRNLVSGSIKHKNSSQVAKRPLKICTYDGYIPEGYGKLKTHLDMLEYMESLMLPISPDNKIIKGKDISKTVDWFRNKKGKLDFPTDGLVIKLNSLISRDALGSTTHSPRWARALKFEALLKETKIINIDFAVGRTGKITPRAEVEPVQLAGTTVRFATLHNQNYIDELGVGIGAKVKVAKRGEIIPAVEEVVEPGNQGIFKIPECCPYCNTPAIHVNDSVDLFCPNNNCPERKKNAIIFFCQKKQMDIAGLGEKQIENLYNLEYIDTIIDLYTLHEKEDELAEIEGFGKKSVKIILDGIEKSKEKDLRFTLPSLGLNEVGHKVTELLIESGYDDIDKIINLIKSKSAKETLLEIHGLGERTVDSIIAQFKDKEILKQIQTLKKYGVNFKAKLVKKSDKQPFLNQTWCVTGTFQNFQPRDKAMDLIVFHGGKKTSSISSKTTHLLAGEGSGSKLQKANELGVKVITEDEFIKILKKEGIK